MELPTLCEYWIPQMVQEVMEEGDVKLLGAALLW